MYDLLDSGQKERLQLIQHLTNFKQAQHLTDISLQLQLSSRTIRYHIDEINEFCADFAHIHIESSHCRIRYKNSFEYEDIFRFYIRHSSKFLLLHFLFNKKTVSMKELEECLHLSTSSCRRLIRETNRIFEQNQLNIHILPYTYQIEGNEATIRNFFLRLFLDIFSESEWPFSEIKAAKVDDCLLKCIRYVHVRSTIDAMMYRLMKYLFTINLIRTSKGYYYPQNLLKFKSYTQIFLKERELLELSEQISGLELTNGEVYQLFLPYNHANFILSTDEIWILTVTNSFINRSISYLQTHLQRLSEHFNLSLKDNRLLLLVLHNIGWIYNLTKVNTSYQSKVSTQVDKIREDYPNFYLAARKEVEDYAVKMEYLSSDKFVDNMLYNLFSHWPGLVRQLYQQLPKLNIALVCNYEAQLAYQLCDLLISEFNGQITLNVCQGLDTRIQDIDQAGYDFIISSFHPNTSLTTPSLILYDFPSRKDLPLLKAQILYHIDKNSFHNP